MFKYFKERIIYVFFLIKTFKYFRLLDPKKNKNLSIYGYPLNLKAPEKIELGQNCRINEYVFLHGGGGIKVGDDVTFSAYSKVISWGYETNNWPSNSTIKKHAGAEIIIGNGAWIGSGSIILPGVKLTGKGIIVAAGAIVTNDCDEDYVVLGGIPAKIIKRF